jgi:hypothetical protein
MIHIATGKKGMFQTQSKTGTPKPRLFKRGECKRCDAFIKNIFVTSPNGTTRTKNPRCRNWAMPNGRCRLHGGLSTGAKTPEGKARQVQAMVEGRRHWVERMKAEGRKFPGGRKSGPDWITPKLRERAGEEALRGYRPVA